MLSNFYEYISLIHAKPPNPSPSPCGEVLLSYAAILSLHFLACSVAPATSINKMTEFQKVVCAKWRSTRRNVAEGILQHQVRHVAEKGLERAGLVVVEDSVLTPCEFTCHEFVFGATERMEGGRYPEPAWGGSHTISIR